MLTNLRKGFFERHRKELIERLLQEKRSKVMHVHPNFRSITANQVQIQSNGMQCGTYDPRTFQSSGSNCDSLKDQINKAIELVDCQSMIDKLDEYGKNISCHYTPIEGSFIYSLMPLIEDLMVFGKLESDLGRCAVLTFLHLLNQLSHIQPEAHKDRRILEFSTRYFQRNIDSRDHEMLKLVVRVLPRYSYWSSLNYRIPLNLTAT